VVRGCPVPVVIAGGPKTSTDKQLLERIDGAMEAGARGAAIGRNVFQHQGSCQTYQSDMRDRTSQKARRRSPGTA